VRLPSGATTRFRRTFAALKVAEKSQGGAVSAPLTHKVRRGETPTSIANRYKVSVRALMSTNGLRSARQMKVGKVLRIPGRGRGRTLDQLADLVVASMPNRTSKVALN
jgi:LysM repeat protein